MRVGICGYPGSGKSTVFAALAPGAQGHREVSYGNIKVPDERIDRLTRIYKPRKTVYAEIDFVDVGGEQGKSRGAFSPAVVQNMRNADALVHVVRGFDAGEPCNPVRDVRLFDDEILLLDLGVLEKRVERFRKEARSDSEAEVTFKCYDWLDSGKPLRTCELDERELKALSSVQLLSLKPIIILYNLSEDNWANPVYASLRELQRPGPETVSLALCGELEAEIATMDAADQAEMLQGLGLGQPARIPFVQAAYQLLDYISFLTAGPDECRAWTIRRGWNARRAAGRVHTDIERGFIRAEVFRLEDLEATGSEAAMKAQGKLRVEGKEYIVKDGDVMNFRFNV